MVQTACLPRLIFGFEAQKVLRGGQPCAEYAQRDDEAEYQRHFAKCEETPADVQAVGFENRVHQRPYFGQQPGRQAPS